MRDSQADVVACVSLLRSARPWCFLCVGGLERAAPRWVFLDGYEAEPELELSVVAAALRSRLDGSVDGRERDEQSDLAIEQFVSRLRACEHALLPVRRRRALDLLQAAIEGWIDAARAGRDFKTQGELRELREWLALLPEERRAPFPDPGSVSDAWLRLLRPRLRRTLEARRGRRRPWRLNDLLPDLLDQPIPVEQIWRAFDGVQMLPPVDLRIVAMIVGVG